MSFDGNGVYSLPAGNPVVNGTTIDDSWANTTLEDIETALTNSLCKDGQSTPTANIKMGSYKLTGLGAGTTNGDSVRFEQLVASAVPYTPAGSGAVTTYVQTKLREFVSVKDFGATGDGSTDDTSAISTAIVYAQLTLRNLYFPAGIYKITSTIALSGSPIGFIGEDNAPMQQGSTRPSVTLRWYGGASPMFTSAGSAFSFVGMAADNFGSATDFLYVTAAQHLLFKRMSFLIGSGASQFSRSVVYSFGNNLGYSRFETIHCLGAAPKFIGIDGNASGNGFTPISITGRSLFESNSAGALTVVWLKDIAGDAIIIQGNTFNQQSATNELTILDTTTSARSTVLTSFVFEDNEWDSVSTTAAHRALKLKNVKNASINRNALQGGGTVTAWADLTASTVTSFRDNWAESFGGALFSCDATSRVYPGINQLNTGNTSGIQNDPGTGKAGGVLQVVSVAMSTQRSTASTSYTDVTGLTASITPLSATSKILVIVNVNGIAVTSSVTRVSLQLVRGVTSLIEFEKEACYSGSVTTELAVGGSGATYVDAPATTSSTTYKIQFKANANTVFVSTSDTTSTITLMEVAA